MRIIKKLPGLPVERALAVLSGRWKAVILYVLLDGPQRTCDLEGRIVGVSQKALIEQLRALEEHGVVSRQPHGDGKQGIEYLLTPLGASLGPILHALIDWGTHHAQALQEADRLLPCAAVVRPAPPARDGTARLHVAQSGAGEKMMFLHGWTCDSSDWAGQLPYFQARYQVVAVDLRGHGKSEVVATGGYTPDDYVADIEALIMTRYAGAPFIIVGHSMGAQIAARLAARRPDLVRAIVSVEGALGFSEGALKSFERTARGMDAEDPRPAVAALFQQVYGVDTEAARKAQHLRRLQEVPPHVIRETFAPLFIGSTQAGVGAASAALCASVAAPFYHLCVNPAQADRMRPWFSHPKAKVQAWPGAGHWLMQDRPDEVNAAIAAWLASL